MSNRYAMQAEATLSAITATNHELEELLEVPARDRDNGRIAACHQSMNIGSRMAEAYALLAVADAIAVRDKTAGGPAVFLEQRVGGTLEERLTRAELEAMRPCNDGGACAAVDLDGVTL